MKSKQPRLKLNRQIVDEASEWFVDFRVGDVDSSARERFDLWLRQSPEHIRAYMEIANTYVLLPALNPTRKVDVRELIAYARSDGNVVPFDHTTRPNQPLSRPADLDGESRVERGAANAHRSPRRRRPSVFALAASISIACVAASLLALLAVQWHSTYATDIGERRSITLEDGSTIDLNARSKVRVRFSKGERHVELIEGQALFGVAHDVSRPFIVRSGTAVVRAVGTQFDVYRKRSGTTVTVVEGRVAVFSNDPPQYVEEVTRTEDQGLRKKGGLALSPQHSVLSTVRSPRAVFVSAGEQVMITEREVAEPKHTNIAATTAWTQHRLIFDATPLGDVVDEFNRYNTRQLVIEDGALDNFHISGVYSSTDPASFISFLRQQPGIEVIETDEGVRITRK